MLIREYRESDLAALRAIHAAQGFDYPLPDLRNPLFLTKLVLTGDSADANVAPRFSAAVFPSNDAPHDNPKPARSLTDAKSKNTDHGALSTEHENRAGNCAPQNAASSPILGAVFLRLTAEAYLLLDPKAGSPGDRWQWLLGLHAATERDAWLRGLEDVHAWLPPSIAAKFGKRIATLGWRRDDAWTPYCKRLATPQQNSRS